MWSASMWVRTMCRTSRGSRPSAWIRRTAVSSVRSAGRSAWRIAPRRPAGSAMSCTPIPESTSTSASGVSTSRTRVGTRPPIVPQLSWWIRMGETVPTVGRVRGMAAGGVLDPRPVVRVERQRDGGGAAAGSPPASSDAGWPYSIPAVAQLLRDGLELDDLTVLVGENGTGKSTIVEAVAMAYGLGAEGGSVNGRDVTWESESPLHESVTLVRGGGASKWGYFLRAETMHGMFTYLQSSGPEQDFHSRSHGEAFWDLVSTSRF